MLTVMSISRQPLAHPIFHQNQLLIFLHTYISFPLPDTNVWPAVIQRILRTQPPSALLPNLPLIPPRNLATSFTMIEDTRTNQKTTISSCISYMAVLSCVRRSPQPPRLMSTIQHSTTSSQKDYMGKFSGLTLTYPTYYLRMPPPYLPL
jgi:hypothetical protein